MPRAHRAARVLVAAACLISGEAGAKGRAPQWLQDASAAPMPSYPPQVPAIVLEREEALSIDPQGRVRGTARGAVKVLLPEGRKHCWAEQHYVSGGGSVLGLKAWLVPASGDGVEYGKGRVLDLPALPNDVYNEVRLRRVRADEADPGSVFGYAAEYEERSFTSQFLFEFQDELPVRHASFSIEVPAGWTVRATTFNHAPLSPTVVGSRYTWEMRDLPFLEEEPWTEPTAARCPRLAVTAVPPPGAVPSGMATFGSWREVAGWLDRMCAAASTPSAAIQEKARALTARCATEYDRIRAIGSHVQSLNYIAIQMGVARGGGYKPHPAAEVFAKGYGDCKDKANLMKSMLGSVGIESYLAAIRADDSSMVRAEWPTPLAFNHCIVAVRVSSDSLPASVRHPSLGTLLLFDPTDSETELGDLPLAEQGSYALLIAPQGGLVRSPVLPTEANRCERRIDAALDASGSVRGHLIESTFGQLGADERRLFHGATPDEYQRTVEGRLARGAESAVVSKVSARDRPSTGFDLDLEFTIPRYAQPMGGGRLLVYRPELASEPERVVLSASTRTRPIVLKGAALHECTTVRLPPGFDVAPFAPALTLKTEFGTYRAHCEVQGDKLLFTRSLIREPMTVPANRYEELRGFFEQVRIYEETPVVLSKR